MGKEKKPAKKEDNSLQSMIKENPAIEVVIFETIERFKPHDLHSYLSALNCHYAIKKHMGLSISPRDILHHLRTNFYTMETLDEDAFPIVQELEEFELPKPDDKKKVLYICVLLHCVLILNRARKAKAERQKRKNKHETCTILNITSALCAQLQYASLIEHTFLSILALLNCILND